MIIPGSNPPTTKTYPQTMYWVDLGDMSITKVELVRNCGWHSMLHVTNDGKTVRDSRLFATALDAMLFARANLKELQCEVDRKAENYYTSLATLLAGGDL